MAFTLLLLKTFEGCDCGFPKIVVRPGIGPLNSMAATKIVELLGPNKHFPGLVRREHPHNFDERFLTGAKNHGFCPSFPV